MQKTTDEHRRVHALLEIPILLFLTSGEQQLQIMRQSSDGWCEMLFTNSNSELKDRLPPMPGHLEEMMVEHYSALFGLPNSQCEIDSGVATTGKEIAVLNFLVSKPPAKHLVCLTLKHGSISCVDYRKAIDDYFRIKRQEMTVFEKFRDTARSFAGKIEWYMTRKTRRITKR
ncbi:hypothetical protein OAG71_00440 [bacterium]|nr:hypothetical protein [bacterium]